MAKYYSSIHCYKPWWRFWGYTCFPQFKEGFSEWDAPNREYLNKKQSALPAIEFLLLLLLIIDNICVWLSSFCIQRQIIFLLVLEDSDCLLNITVCYHGNDCDLRNVSAEAKKKCSALRIPFPSGLCALYSLA